MFEVGKKYVNTNWLNELYECVAIHGEKGWLLFNGKPLTYDWSGNWKEHKEPRTITRWINVYERGDELYTFPDARVYSSKEDAERGIQRYHSDVKYVTTTSFSYTEPR